MSLNHSFCQLSRINIAIRVSQKIATPPLKLFCNIFTQAKCVSVKFCQLVASLYPHTFTNFSQIILIFNKMALIFRSTYFYSFKFRVPDCAQIAVTSSLMMSGPNSPDLNPLHYQAWGKCWSLITSCNRSQKQFQSVKMHSS